ncbi:uncharacterized protein MELLADRAFT_73764 [Melampsora larici-populina 98AG31]|uniref:Uncharacterized protein n=1 Tax=Melampsora larici-populina (strain 98AG31 / pathotype 3-4-7) TaxID=747676 RepID=F4SEN8_MELLP|nr:uncharacterized protein MELLADRAFT_73764 [Melampsora larici-populina 98AG31]EGF96888.1 hypothetical protein MELLADRAFT_73764 [Melampsora larici-populina 98AG31]
MAWDIAKNIDIITQPSDFSIVLSSETLPGQFDCLFVAFSQWKNGDQTAGLLAEAADRRTASYRANKTNKVPQSCEGAQLTKARAESAKSATKLATEQAKKDASQAKAAEKAARDQRKLEAEEQKKRMQVGAIALDHANPQALEKPPSAKLKRVAEDFLEGGPSRQLKGNPPTTTRPKHPTNTAKIDPRLCPQGSI